MGSGIRPMLCLAGLWVGTCGISRECDAGLGLGWGSTALEGASRAATRRPIDVTPSSILYVVEGRSGGKGRCGNLTGGNWAEGFGGWPCLSAAFCSTSCVSDDCAWTARRRESWNSDTTFVCSLSCTEASWLSSVNEPERRIASWGGPIDERGPLSVEFESESLSDS